MIGRLGDNYLWALTIGILAAALLMSSGFVIIDETVYYLGARALADSGTFGLDNGYSRFQSEDLQLWFLVDGPQGLTPQYPAGSALLAWPLLPFLGTRAFIAINAVAAVLTLFTVRKICLAQFKSEFVAKVAIGLLVIGSFWGEYAFGIWPHALTVFFSTQAYWFALRHIDSDGSDWRAAVLSGLFAGSGILFRLDAIFIVPAIGLMVLLFTRRFVRSSILVGAGLLPPVAISACLNYLKFGSPNPFSYGGSGGNADLLSYGPLLAALCLAFAVVLALRQMQVRIDRKRMAVALFALGVVALLFPPLAARLWQAWNGFVGLIIDARAIIDHSPGAWQEEGGIVRISGNIKKALGQSLPWIGLTAILLTIRIREEDRRAISTLVIGVAILTIPFILMYWHGGTSHNMRYFLPAVPLLAILCARLFAGLWGSIEAPMPWAAAGAWLAIGCGLAWSMLAPSGIAGVHQIVSTYFLIAMALAAVIAGITWRYQQVAQRFAILLFCSGFLLSVGFAASDFSSSQQLRAETRSIGRALARLPSRSLVIAPAEWIDPQAIGTGTLFARRNRTTGQLDQQLIVDALDAGYRVFIARLEFDPARDVPPGVEPSLTTIGLSEGGQMIELRRRGAAPSPALEPA